MRSIAIQFRGARTRVGSLDVLRVFPGPAVTRLGPFVGLDFFSAERPLEPREGTVPLVLQDGKKVVGLQLTTDPALDIAEGVVVSGSGWTGRWFAGEAQGDTASVAGPTVVAYSLEPGARVTLSAPAERVAFAFVWRGGLAAPHAVKTMFCVTFHANGDEIELVAGPKGAEVVVGTGVRDRGSGR